MQVPGTTACVCCARLFLQIGIRSICSTSVKERKKEKRKARMCFDEVKAQNKPGSLLTVLRFAEI